MDREVIERKLESIRRCIRRIEEKCPASAEELANDLDAQDIVTLNLTRAIQLCVDIGAHLVSATDSTLPETMSQTFDALAELGTIDRDLAARLKKAVGFRNVAVHNYDAVNWAIVHAIATRHLSDFRDFSLAVAQKVGI